MLKVSLISDTHTKHNQIVTSKSFRNSKQQLDLPGGDILIHAGDFMSTGYSVEEAYEFFNWFDSIDNYDTKIFIAGNHDRLMENDPTKMAGILTGYKTIDYLEDDFMGIIYGGEPEIKIWGSPWQPEFYNWAFNLIRNSEELKAKWDAIPNDTDILITHGPPFGYQDTPGGHSIRVGCESYRDWEIQFELDVKCYVFE